jgi:hypothetical protein
MCTLAMADAPSWEWFILKKAKRSENSYSRNKPMLLEVIKIKLAIWRYRLIRAGLRMVRRAIDRVERSK